jgi:hypothetical protein|tara:strand:- start:11 stop:466 length:456 start_codon:yes stop_codon:yes gene_type:complete
MPIAGRISRIEDGTVTTAKLADTAVTTAKITDSNVTKAKTEDAISDNIVLAWASFNGTGTPAIEDDFNVSSITDNGAGDYTVVYTSALPNDDYCCVGMSMRDSDNISALCMKGDANPASYKRTESVRLSNRDNANNAVDCSNASIACFSTS